MLKHFCSSAGQIIINARYKSFLERRNKIKEGVLEISREITRIQSGGMPLETTTKLICENMDVQLTSIFLYEENKLITKSNYPYSEQTDDFIEKYNDGEFLCGKAFRKGSEIFYNNLHEIIINEREHATNKVYLPAVHYFEKMLDTKLRNVIFAPLYVGEESTPIGVIRMINKVKENDFGEKDFDETDIDMIKLIAAQVAITIHNSRLFGQIKEAENQAKEAKSRFQNLFEKSPDGIVIIQPELSDGKGHWRIIDCNEAFASMNGYSREEIKTIQDIKELSKKPENREQYYKKLKENSHIETEVVHLRKDGSEFYIQALSCLIELDGRECVLGFDRNITELKKAFVKIEKFASIGIASTLVEHISLGLLDKIKNGVNYLSSGKFPNENQIISMEESIEQIKQYSRMIIEFYREGELGPHEYSLENLLKEIKESFLFFEKNLRIEITLEHIEQQYLYIEKTAIHFIFFNLFKNSTKAKNKDIATIKIQAFEEDDFIKILITDDGPGIQSNNLKNIFTKPLDSKNEGSGIGLTLCRHLIERNSGTIEYDEQYKDGAKFIICLPKSIKGKK